MNIHRCFFRLIALLIPAWINGQSLGQDSFAGNYSGSVYSGVTGFITQPTTAVAPLICTIDAAGNIRSGSNTITGPAFGTVNASGAITFSPPLLGLISSGQMQNSAMTATNVVTTPILVTTYSLFATRKGPVSAPPRILTQPASFTSTNISSQVLLNVEAAGADLSFQWFLGTSGNTASPISGATNPSFLTPRIYGTSNFWVRITNSAGSQNSFGAAISVTGIGQRPAFSSEPISLNAEAGTTVSLNTTVTGTPDFFYRWLKNGTTITNATNNTLQLTNVTLADAGSYQVAVSNLFGSILSSNAVLTVKQKGAPEFGLIPPASIQVRVGGVLKLETAAAGVTPIFFQWYKEVFGRLTPLFAETNSAYIRTNLARNDGGTYAVVAGNAIGSVTNRTLVAVIDAPSISGQPQEVRVSVGQQFSVGPTSFTGSAPTAYQWFKDGQLIPNATNQFYTRTAALADDGNYVIEVSNVAGSSRSDTAAVHVFNGPVPAWIRLEPQAVLSVEQGQQLFITARAEGAVPIQSRWYKDGQLVSSLANNESFQSNAVPITASGQYQLVVSNITGMSTSRVSQVTVFPKQASPQFASTFYSVTKTVGDSVVLEFALKQGDLLFYQWFKQFQTNNNSLYLPLPGETNRTLSLSALSLKDTGSYSLTATNFKGSASGSVQLSVVAPPVITRQPASQEALTGTTVTFTVTVDNFTLDTVIQWFFNGVPIPQSNSVLLSFPMSDARVGEYYMTAKNQAGSVTSQVARLQPGTVTPSAKSFFLIADKTIPIPERSPETFGIQSDGTLNGRVVTFMGTTNLPDVGGIYRYEADKRTKVADYRDILPGFQTATTFLDAQSAEDGGVIHFTAQATNSAQWGLFQWKAGVVTRVFGEGMTFPNKPSEAVRGFGYPQRKGGRTAFLGLGVSADGVSLNGYRGAFVLEKDLTTLVKWADSDSPLPAGTGRWTGNSAQVGFDGSTLAFWAVDSESNNGIFATVEGGLLRKVAFTGDPIPTGGTFRTFSSPPKVWNGRILFIGSGQAFNELYLLEDQNGTLKVLAQSGSSGFSSLQFGFGYAGDGSVLFTANSNGSRQGIFRYRNGSITPELTTFHLINGRTPRFVFLGDVDGDDCVVHLSYNGIDFGLYSTLRPDGTNPTPRPSLSVNRTDAAMTLSWEGGGTLEVSSDLSKWNGSSAVSPATIKFDAANQQFFRIKTANTAGSN